MSNTISNKRVLLKDSVLDAALNRIRWIFDEFPNVMPSVSGGKDSTVIAHLCLQVAREKNRLPLKIMFLDQESEWLSTIENVKELLSTPGVEPVWWQIPFKINSAVSTETNWLHLWDPKEEENWIRPKDSMARTEDVLNSSNMTWYDMFHILLDYEFKEQKACYISGVRTEESPRRASALTNAETYKGVTWGKKLDVKKGHYTFYPIYDWSYTDVWKYIHDNKLSYNKIYDLQYQYGVPVQEMRVSSLHHENSLRSLFFLQEVEPENYLRVVNRIKGADSAGKANYGDFYCPKELPVMFSSWREYRDYLLEKLITNTEHKESMKKMFSDQEPLHLWWMGDKLYRKHIQSILTNDFGGWKLGQFVVPGHLYDEFKKRRNEIKSASKRSNA